MGNRCINYIHKILRYLQVQVDVSCLCSLNFLSDEEEGRGVQCQAFSYSPFKL